MNRAPTGILVCPSSIVAEVLLTGLKAAGVDLATLSIIAPGTQSGEQRGGTAGPPERLIERSAQETCWGGIVGLLLESAGFAVPGIGAVTVAGPFVAMMASAPHRMGAADSATAVGSGLKGIGIRANGVQRYEAALAAGKLLLIVQGTTGDLLRIRLLLEGMGHQLELHQADDAAHAAQATTILMGPLIRVSAC